jgi:hypothetical protein
MSRTCDVPSKNIQENKFFGTCVQKNLQLSPGKTPEIADWALLAICGSGCVLDDEWRASAYNPCVTLSAASLPRQNHPIVQQTCKKAPGNNLDINTSPRMGLPVSKSGALSSQTHGKVFRGAINLSALKLGFHPDYDKQISDWSAQAESRSSGHFLKTWKIVCENNSDGSREAFSIPGDSGSWVWGMNSELVGMLFGGHREPGTMKPTTLFTPFRCILDCLET